MITEGQQNTKADRHTRRQPHRQTFSHTYTDKQFDKEQAVYLHLVADSCCKVFLPIPVFLVCLINTGIGKHKNGHKNR